MPAFAARPLVEPGFFRRLFGLPEPENGYIELENLRLIFDGARKNTVIRLANILSVTPYADAVGIDKTSGRNPIFTVADAEWLTVLLSGVMAHAS